MNRVCLSVKAKHQVGAYLVGFMDPGLAGVHATHGSVPVIFVAFVQSISRVPQAKLSDLPNDVAHHLVQAFKLFFQIGGTVLQGADLILFLQE